MNALILPHFRVSSSFSEPDTIPHVALAWAAGIVDGEGCIHVRRNRVTPTSRHRSDHYSLHVKVTMTHEATVQRVRDIFDCGHITHKSASSCRKAQWNWDVSGNDASYVLWLVYPFLLTKKHECRLGLRFQKLGGAQRGHGLTPAPLLHIRERIYWRLRHEKARGRPPKNSAAE